MKIARNTVKRVQRNFLNHAVYGKLHIPYPSDGNFSVQRIDSLEGLADRKPSANIKFLIN